MKIKIISSCDYEYVEQEVNKLLAKKWMLKDTLIVTMKERLQLTDYPSRGMYANQRLNEVVYTQVLTL